VIAGGKSPPTAPSNVGLTKGTAHISTGWQSGRRSGLNFIFWLIEGSPAKCGAMQSPVFIDLFGRRILHPPTAKCTEARKQVTPELDTKARRQGVIGRTSL
jgi:hypothetical protein